MSQLRNETVATPEEHDSLASKHFHERNGKSNVGRTRGDNTDPNRASSRASFIVVDAVTCVPVYTFIMVPRLRYMYTLYICQIHVPLGVRAYVYVCNLPDSFRDFEISVRGKRVFARAAANPVTNSRLTVDRVKTASIGWSLLIRESKAKIHESITTRENIFFLLPL